MAKKPKKEAGKSQKSIYLPNSLWKKIQDFAASERRTMGNVVEMALEKEFNQ